MSGVRVENLVKQWGDFRAVDGVSFEASEGTLTVLLGPSGCGKSTILRLIAGLEFAESGSVLIDNQDNSGRFCSTMPGDSKLPVTSTYHNAGLAVRSGIDVKALSVMCRSSSVSDPPNPTGSAPVNALPDK